MVKSRNDVDGALNKYKLIDTESRMGSEIWNNVGLCFFKKKKFIAVNNDFLVRKNITIDRIAFLC